MSNVTKPIALDESINTTESTPRNIADVLADELSNIADKIQGGSGGSGGHIIQNSQGANLTQRGTMQFVDSHATDNSAGEKTVIENIKSVTEAQFKSATEDGFYDVDVEGAEIGEISEEYVEVTADGEKTYGALLNELYTLLDSSKLKYDSVLVSAGYSYIMVRNGSRKYFSLVYVPSATSSQIVTMAIGSGNSYSYTSNNGTITDNTNTVPTSGTKITLYYGNDKAVVDLQTTANRCLMSNGDTVENALTTQNLSITPINGTIQAGGVKRIGDLIVINIRYVSTSASVVGDSIITLPYNITSSTAHVQLTNNKNYGIDLLSNKIRTNSAIASGETIIISGTVVVEV